MWANLRKVNNGKGKNRSIDWMTYHHKIMIMIKNDGQNKPDFSKYVICQNVGMR